MTTTAQSAAPTTFKRSLPATVYFDGDHAALKLVAQFTRYYRSSWKSLPESTAGVVVLLSDERLLAEHARELRNPNVRIIAVSDERFRDPRLDSAVYAYVATSTPAPLVERTVDNAIDHMHLLATRLDANQRLAGATHEITELNRIGAALSAEHDTDKLLAMILTKCREITRADAGSLYVVEDQQTDDGTTARVLRFKLAQNDSLDVPFAEATMPLDEQSVAGYVATEGEVVMIEDAYHLGPEVPYSINRKFDHDSGYRTKSVLAVPMKNQQGHVVGVVQLINSKRDSLVRLDSLTAVMADVVPFTERQREVVLSLTSQAAVAYENSQLYRNIQRLFEGFVKASVTAIESRDPNTSGHSFRVANLTVALAEAVNRDTKTFAHVRFTGEQLRELRYAALLHDFGKVAVREKVLAKSRKLYPEQMRFVRQRFELARRTMEYANGRERLDYLVQNGREAYEKKQAEFDQKLAAQVSELERMLAAVEAADAPTMVPNGSSEALRRASELEFAGSDGERQRLLGEDELKMLSISQGSLNNTERMEIESHVIHTYNFLKQIPWTRELSGVPQIARGHHEKLNGSGYPAHLKANDIPLTTRMMTVADVFDALAAGDRPYKQPLGVERALELVGRMVRDGELDPDVYRVFLENRVWERWNIEG